MIARTEPRPKHLSTRALHATFLTMLPAIRRLALIAFRDLDPEAKQEAVQEVTANAFVAVHRLAELGKADLAYPSVLAKYAICQCCTGRKVGSKLNTNDVLSPYAQQRKHIQVGRLDHFDKDDESWREIVVKTKGPHRPTSLLPGSISPLGSTRCRNVTGRSPRHWPRGSRLQLLPSGFGSRPAGSLNSEVN